MADVNTSTVINETGTSDSNVTSHTPSNMTSLVTPEGCLVMTLSATGSRWETDEDPVSFQVENTVDFVVSAVFLNILFLISVPTNMLSLLVFAKQGLRERVNLCLFCQALSDLLYMTQGALLYSDRFWTDEKSTRSVGPMVRLFLGHQLIMLYGFLWTSAFTQSIISAERCLCVVSPLRSRRMLQTRLTLVVLVLGYALILAVSYISALRWSVRCVYDPATGTTIDAVSPSPFYFAHMDLVLAVDVHLFSIAFPWTFGLFVSLTTFFTVLSLRHMTSWREKASSAMTSQRELALTRMLVGTSAVFVVTLLPMVTRTWMLVEPRLSLGGRWHNLFNLLVDLGELTSYVNASSHFFVYCWLGSRFRHTLRSLCCPFRSPQPVAA